MVKPPVKNIDLVYLYRYNFEDTVHIFIGNDSYILDYVEAHEWLMLLSLRKLHLVDTIFNRLWNGIYICYSVSMQAIKNMKLNDFPDHIKTQIKNESYFYLNI